MSLPSSSFARSTPRAVPPTQNTAPVIKFRCLFTHDLRRKAKRWQDGFLRFHTFNKRAMVYDDLGNFIGDHHWRESGEIQDGDELELDKGVLVQVGECMEKTQNDISALFEKRKASQESPSQQKPTIPPSSRASINSQSTPLKSLNDVLGIKRPSIGRSITPQSPYEQRQQQSRKSEDAEGDRPAKRQRHQPGEVLQRRSTNEPLRRPPVIDLEKSPSQSPSREIRPAKPLPQPESQGERANKDSASRTAPAPTTAAQGLLKKQTETGTRSSTATSFDARPPENTPINPLRILNDKPRQKLMYRALLPPKASNKAGSTETSQTRQVSSYDSHVIDREGPSNEFGVSDSTLALFDELTDDAAAKVVTDRPPKESPSQAQEKTLYSVPLHSTVSGSPPGIDSTEKTTQQPRQQSISEATAAKRTAPLARSSSDAAAMSDSRPAASAQEAPAAANPAVATKRTEPKIFRKSLSDPTALRNADSNHHRPSRPVATTVPPGRPSCDDDSGEKGPWTAEALDFFDWWPPGRPKPA
ncbi:hypothetical protein VTN77DRAFT_2974 [Rasamsonia byssochlamydoides]|uniref:uncharacterized protein n=1 Tax=Rasamsonia byssochlamydoides TaxID=89139 RepID=UPI0037427B75